MDHRINDPAKIITMNSLRRTYERFFFSNYWPHDATLKCVRHYYLIWSAFSETIIFIYLAYLANIKSNRGIHGKCTSLGKSITKVIRRGYACSGNVWSETWRSLRHNTNLSLSRSIRGPDSHTSSSAVCMVPCLCMEFISLTCLDHLIQKDMNDPISALELHAHVAILCLLVRESHMKYISVWISSNRFHGQACGAIECCRSSSMTDTHALGTVRLVSDDNPWTVILFSNSSYRCLRWEQYSGVVILNTDSSWSQRLRGGVNGIHIQRC